MLVDIHLAPDRTASNPDGLSLVQLKGVCKIFIASDRLYLYGQDPQRPIASQHMSSITQLIIGECNEPDVPAVD